MSLALAVRLPFSQLDNRLPPDVQRMQALYRLGVISERTLLRRYLDRLGADFDREMQRAAAERREQGVSSF